MTNIADKTPSDVVRDVVGSNISDEDRQEILSLLKTVYHTETDELNTSMEEEIVDFGAAVTIEMVYSIMSNINNA